LASASRFETQRSILSDLDSWPAPGGFVLDFGCGNGDLVDAYRAHGFQAFGCDLSFKEGESTEALKSQGILSLISREPYRLPYDDGTFDLVVSDQVFEHVHDYGTALSEIRRVLKRGGASLHLFPSRYRIVEPHVYVPFGTMIQGKGWLKLWALAGIRSESQTGCSASETAKRNHTYLCNSTNYLAKRQIRRRFQEFFEVVRFSEDLFLKQSKRASAVNSLSRILPWLPDIYSTLESRVVFTKKK
jgi:SAM-dependent methyltransferase